MELILEMKNRSNNKGSLEALAHVVRKTLDNEYQGPPVKIKGKPEQVNSLKIVLKAERKYADLYQQHGPDFQQTIKAMHELQSAIDTFERQTGLQWPLR